MERRTPKRRTTKSLIACRRSVAMRRSVRAQSDSFVVLCARVVPCRVYRCAQANFLSLDDLEDIVSKMDQDDLRCRWVNADDQSKRGILTKIHKEKNLKCNGAWRDESLKDFLGIQIRELPGRGPRKSNRRHVGDEETTETRAKPSTAQGTAVDKRSSRGRKKDKKSTTDKVTIDQFVDTGNPNVRHDAPGESPTALARVPPDSAKRQKRYKEIPFGTTPSSDSYTLAFAADNPHRIWNVSNPRISPQISVSTACDDDAFVNTLLRITEIHNEGSDLMRFMMRSVVQPWYVSLRLTHGAWLAQSVIETTNMLTPKSSDFVMQEKVLCTAMLLAFGRRVAFVNPMVSVVRVNILFSSDAMTEYVFGVDDTFEPEKDDSRPAWMVAHIGRKFVPKRLTGNEQGGHVNDFNDSADVWKAPTKHLEGLQTHRNSCKSPIAKEIVAWMKYRDDWPQNPSEEHQPFWWNNGKLKGVDDFWTGTLATSLKLCVADSSSVECDLYLMPQTKWFEGIAPEASRIDDNLKLVLLRCWVSEYDGREIVFVDKRQCLPIAIIHCVSRPWFGNKDGSDIVSNQQLMRLEKTIALSESVVDAYLHGAYSSCLWNMKKSEVCIRAPSVLTCDKLGNAYAHCLIEYIKTQKSCVEKLRFIECHRFPLYHVRYRYLSFVVFNISEAYNESPSALYEQLLHQCYRGKHSVLPDRPVSFPHSLQSLCMNHVLPSEPSTSSEPMARSIVGGDEVSFVYQSKFAIDVILFAIRNKFVGHHTKVSNNGPNETVIFVVSTDREVLRPTKKKASDLQSDMQLECILRLSLHDRLDDMPSTEFHTER